MEVDVLLEKIGERSGSEERERSLEEGEGRCGVEDSLNMDPFI